MKAKVVSCRGWVVACCTQLFFPVSAVDPKSKFPQCIDVFLRSPRMHKTRFYSAYVLFEMWYYREISLKWNFLGGGEKKKIEIKLEEKLNCEPVYMWLSSKHMIRFQRTSQDLINSVLEDLEISAIPHCLLSNCYEPGTVPGLGIQS